jgi:DNA-binding CsgD family transcriptional regulator
MTPTKETHQSPDASDDEVDAARSWWRPIAILTIVAALIAIDIVSDLLEHTDLAHVFLELIVALIAVGGIVYYARLALRERDHRRALSVELVRAEGEQRRLRAEADAWRKEARDAVNGLSDAIDRQFVRWGLTNAEREVALLLLKGLSHKEAANARGTSERTVRQQSLTIYKKAGVTGRAELSAFFLEDLLAPRTESEMPRTIEQPQGEGAIST